MSTVVASVAPTYLETVGGQTVRLTLSVANSSPVIDAYTLRVYGLDAAWVTATPARLSLFPDDIGQVVLELTVPQEFPAGLRQISVHVQSENDPSDFALGSLTLNVADRPLVSLHLDPVTITGGAIAQFGMVIVNKGNAAVDVVPTAVDPEELAQFVFEPPMMHLLPGEQQVVQANVATKRPWVGAPKVRVLTFRATAVGRAEAIGTFVQRPRIGRWMLSLIGLMAAASVFAAVLSRTLNNVVDEARVDPRLVNAALDDGSGGGQTVSLNPATVKGSVVSFTSGAGIAGVQAQLFAANDGTVPLASAASADDGSFAFGRLSKGTYRLRFTGAGFSDLWFSAGRVFAEATDIEVPGGGMVELPPMSFGGRPGSIFGKVVAANPLGTVVTLIRAGLADPTVPAIVASVDVSADGSFVLGQIPSPATYQLVAERPGSAAETRSIVLEPGAVVEDVVIVLRPGDGVISGRVSAEGTAIGGVTISASDGTNIVSTVSLTEGTIGAYVLRNLATPGVYTVTVTRDGFLPQTRTINLQPAGSSAADWALLPATGSIDGEVLDSNGQSVGGVEITLTGGDVELAARSVSPGTGGTLPAGTYRFEQLPAPGTYTLTFSLDGLVSQVRLVNIGGSGPSAVTGIDIVMSPSKAVIRGIVRNLALQPVSNSTLTLTNGVSTRILRSADEPVGEFSFANVEPGTYTLTAELQGAAAVVQLVTVQAGDALNVALELGQQASLSGRVVLPDLVTPGVGFEVRLFLPAQFPGGTVLAYATTDVNGRYSFSEVAAQEDFVVAVYAGPGSVVVLDSELVVSVPGIDVVIQDLIGV